MFKSIFINLIIAAYFLLGIDQFILNTGISLTQTKQTNPEIALLIFALIIADFTSILLYRKHLTFNKSLTPIFILGHLVIGTMLTMFFINAVWGIFLDNNIAQIMLIFLTVIKELIIIFLLIDPPKEKHADPVKILIADIIGAIFFCLTFTLIWNTIYATTNPPQNAGEFLAMTVIYILFLIPIRFIPITKELYESSGSLSKQVSLFVSYILVFLFATGVF